MNDVAQIVDFLSLNFPDVDVSVDTSDSPSGPTWLDLRRNGVLMTIEYRPQVGFGLYHRNSEGSVGVGPDEIHAEVKFLLPRLRSLTPAMDSLS